VGEIGWIKDVQGEVNQLTTKLLKQKEGVDSG